MNCYFSYNDKKGLYDEMYRKDTVDRITKTCEKIEEYYWKDFGGNKGSELECRFIIHSTSFQGAAELYCSKYDIFEMKKTINLYPYRIKMIVNELNENELEERIEQLLFDYYIARELFYCMDKGLSGTLSSKDDETKKRAFLFFGAYFALSYIDYDYGKKYRDLLLYIICKGGSDRLNRIYTERDYKSVQTAIIDGVFLLRYGIKHYEGNNHKGKKLKYYECIYNAYVNGNYGEDDGVKELLEKLRRGKRYLSEDESRKLESLIKKYELDGVEYQLENNALKCIYKSAVKKDGNRTMIDEGLLCIYHSIRRFMETGSKYDAFDVYCCYTDRYLVGDKLQELINFISSYENNASRLVQKHRDHYSHSVYVFILGLAIYQTNIKVRETFKKTYKFTSNYLEHMAGDSSDESIDEKFIRLWGLTSLFHDIGYQFEIPFTQIKENENNCFKYESNDGFYEHTIFFHYHNMDKFTELKNFFKSCESKAWGKGDLMHYDDDYQYYISALVNNDDKAEKEYIEDVFAWHIDRRLHRSFSQETMLKGLSKNTPFLQNDENELDTVKYISKLLKAKPTPVENIDDDKKEAEVYMDHAYYSAILIFKQMIQMFGLDRFTDNRVEDSYLKSKMAEKYKVEKKFFVLNEWMDAITAIVMHNKFFEYNLKKDSLSSENGLKRGRPLALEEHPLAYLLILCDELQCWDRTSFGKKSIEQLHAMGCKFEFKNDGIYAHYVYDENCKSGALDFDGEKIVKIKKGTLGKFYNTITPAVVRDKNIKPQPISTAHLKDKCRVCSDDHKPNGCEFVDGIARIVAIPGGDVEVKTLDEDKNTKGRDYLSDYLSKNGISLNVEASFGKDKKKRTEYLSESSMRELYDMAEKLYQRTKDDDWDDFKYTDGAEKLLYIQFVKNMGKCLHEIGCFYSNQPKVFERVIGFSKEEKAKIEEIQKEPMSKFCDDHLLEHIDDDLAVMVEEFDKMLVDESGIEVYRI